MLTFKHQNSTQTLQQGIEEYSRAFEDQLTSRSMSPEAITFFRCHDAVHVVFGCDVTLEDEAVVKVTSFFGTDGRAEVMQGYRLPESNEIYGGLDWVEIVTTTAKAFFLVPRTIWRCSRMTKRWPWKDFDRYLGTSLAEIRRQFGITVAHPHGG